MMALLNRGHRREIEQAVRRIEKLETALEPHFQQLFVDAMALPNRVDPFPNLAGEVKLPPQRPRATNAWHDAGAGEPAAARTRTFGSAGICDKMSCAAKIRLWRMDKPRPRHAHWNAG
ncbi:ASKHA domain-containing protein [Paracoccus denitrificans]|jgi:hypothetical protein|uniref:ASKHA domain-containing protein n=1 Tax=Paracoccus denitrificans TaxID=266 RepID=UPI003DA74112